MLEGLGRDCEWLFDGQQGKMATGGCREGSVRYLVVGQLVLWRGKDVGREPADLAEVPPVTNR